MVLVFKCNQIFMPINVKCEIASMTWLIGHWIIVFRNSKGVNCTFRIHTLMLHNFVLNIFKHLCKCYFTSSTLFVRFSYIYHVLFHWQIVNGTHTFKMKFIFIYYFIFIHINYIIRITFNPFMFFFILNLEFIEMFQKSSWSKKQ